MSTPETKSYIDGWAKKIRRITAEKGTRGIYGATEYENDDLYMSYLNHTSFAVQNKHRKKVNPTFAIFDGRVHTTPDGREEIDATTQLLDSVIAGGPEDE